MSLAGALMVQAEEYAVARPGLFFWQAYDGRVKTELSCCAWDGPEGLVFYDPVRLADAALEELLEGRRVAGIALTSGNHERDAVWLAERLGVEIWANAGAREAGVRAERWCADGERVCGAVAVELAGFAEGETAYWGAGVLVVGDAVIHAAPYGFAMLPEKYCKDAAKGRESLKRLLDYEIEVLMMAHGLPVVARAKERLAGLVGR